MAAFSYKDDKEIIKSLSEEIRRTNSFGIYYLSKGFGETIKMGCSIQSFDLLMWNLVSFAIAEPRLISLLS